LAVRSLRNQGLNMDVSVCSFRRRSVFAGAKYALYSVPDFGECRWTLGQDNLFGKLWRP
jgi:hypothetical protein